MDNPKLSIKINNKAPIELNQLTSSLNALAREYDLYCKEKLGLPKNNRRLEIIKLEQGCLLIELVSVLNPLFAQINPVLDFGKYFIQTLDFFSGKSDEAPTKYTKKNCDNIYEFSAQTANDKGSNIQVSVVGNNNKVYIGGELSSIESNATQNELEKYKNALLEEQPRTLHKQAFYWASASFSQSKNQPLDRGLIESLDKKPHKTIFDTSSSVKESMTKYNEDLQKDWQDLIYIVDVEVIKVQDVIKSYKILNVYLEDTLTNDE